MESQIIDGFPIIKCEFCVFPSTDRESGTSPWSKFLYKHAHIYMVIVIIALDELNF